MFERDVAKGRKMKVSDVQQKLGQGKVFNATKAKSSGMVDSIGTLDDVLGRFGVSRQPGTQAKSRGAMPVASTMAATPEDAACACPCDGCADGDCGDCSTDDCSYDSCDCDAAAGNADARVKVHAAHAHRLRSIDIALLQ